MSMSMGKGKSDVRYRRMLAALIDARKGLGLLQSDVASRLAKPQQFVSRYELGERRLDVFEFVDVATALGLDAIAVLSEIVAKESAD
jgi:transcriptional regulator with XRE-family HTH domain